jgi:Ser/Thr protein kinase RdoA (MazF antagonist)
MAIKNTPYTSEELQEILGCFIDDVSEYFFEPITNGYINDTFLVNNDGGPLFILQRINHEVFKDVEGIMQNIAKATKKLIATDYQPIKVYGTRNGKPHTTQTSGHWRLMEYISGSTTYDTTMDHGIAKEAGRIIGKFHLLMQNERTSLYTDTLPQFHDLDLRYAQYQKALIGTTEDRKTMAEPAMEKLDTIYAHLQEYLPEKLPLRVCHNDTKLNNILFSKHTEKALCLIDLDTLMGGYFLYDFGDAVRTIANTAREDEKNLNLISFDKNKFTAFVKGLAMNGPVFMPNEIDSLSYGVILMPFLHGIRALTDFLNFDAYYKISYPSQNLDRALSLLQFSKMALDAEAFIAATVKEYLLPKG